LVDVGVTAVGISATLDDKGFETGGGVAEGSTGAHYESLVEFLLGIALEEGGALDRLQIGADASLAQVVDDGLANIGEGSIAIERAGVDAAGMARLGKQPFRRGDVVHRFRRLPIELEVGRHKSVVGQL